MWIQDSHRVRWSLVLLVFSMTLGIGAVSTWAQQAPPQVISGYRTGKITAVQGNTVTIDYTVYELAPDLEVTDIDGKPLEVSSIMVKARAKFQVKREQANRIVKMVLMFPE